MHESGAGQSGLSGVGPRASEGADGSSGGVEAELAAKAANEQRVEICTDALVSAYLHTLLRESE